MVKVQKISGITPRIPFTEFNFYDLYRITFENSVLGRTLLPAVPGRDNQPNPSFDELQAAG